jgi:2-keto-4-pentenoate hydratase/2-oxohepta-3-ene-1,7-dioic acid hydratase in catechol pathway
MDKLDFHLTNNGQIVQQGNAAQMLWKIDELIAYVSQYFTLKIGDIIFTGTPAGVATIKENDVLEGFLEGQSLLKIQVK